MTEEKIVALDQVLVDFYAKQQVAPSLAEGILYSIQAGGKRIRPVLLLEILEAFGQEITGAHLKVAGALEMIHTASLIHDDLPAMDNDDYRRGRLTNHKVFGEDKAILAGDSLFLDPFALLAEADLPAEILVALISHLSLAAGTYGMVAGQVLDMGGEGRSLSLSDLQAIHAHKTGKLLAYPFVAAGLILGLSEKEQTSLRAIGEKIGLAFQVRDDLLDITASFEELGKTPQKDLAAQKATYPALMGLEGAQAFLNQTLDEALLDLDQLSQTRDFQKEILEKRIESLRMNG